MDDCLVNVLEIFIVFCVFYGCYRTYLSGGIYGAFTVLVFAIFFLYALGFIVKALKGV